MNSLTFFPRLSNARLEAATASFVVAHHYYSTQKEQPTMPLFNSSDYENLHPELEQVPSGMTDNSYTIAMYHMYTAWITEVIENATYPRAEIRGAFEAAPELWTRVAPVHPEDDPRLTLLLVATGTFAQLVQSVHVDSRASALEHVHECLRSHLSDGEQIAYGPLLQPFCDATTVFAEDSDEVGLLFLMRIIDLAHDENGCVDDDNTVQVAQLATVGAVGILTGISDPSARAQLLEALRRHVEAVAAEPILPYFEGDHA
jgi:hypothetical protein